MWKHRGLLAAAFMVVALIAVGCQRQQAQQPAAPAQPAAQVPDLGGREVRVATDATYQPFEFQDKDKNIVGYDIDLINAHLRPGEVQAKRQERGLGRHLPRSPKG